VVHAAATISMQSAMTSRDHPAIAAFPGDPSCMPSEAVGAPKIWPTAAAGPDPPRPFRRQPIEMGVHGVMSPVEQACRSWAARNRRRGTLRPAHRPIRRPPHASVVNKHGVFRSMLSFSRRTEFIPSVGISRAGTDEFRSTRVCAAEDWRARGLCRKTSMPRRNSLNFEYVCAIWGMVDIP